MGLDYSVYLGPYVECKWDINPKPDHWEVREDIGDRMCVPQGDSAHEEMEEHKAHYWVPNVTANPPVPWLEFDPKEHGWISTDVTAKAIDDACKEFVKFFAPEIAILRKRYPDVSVKFGLMSYIW